jgi:DMSO/TMAO reductase YedYZ molybdopterin-dependent catalytic subunit
VREWQKVRNSLRRLLSVACIVLGVVVAVSGRGQQGPPAAQLRLVGLGGVERVVTAEDWKKLPRAAVEAKDHGGAIVTFEGVPARELLKIAAVPLGPDLRGQQLALYVVAEAADGYKAVYALPEFDAAFTDGLILIADRRNGEALPPKEGPLRMVVPWEKRQARWVRQLTTLRLQQAL